MGSATKTAYKIIDISQPISSRSACFPGDTPFSKVVTLSMSEGAAVNLTSLTMSPHVGTHADSPVHVEGSMVSCRGMAGDLPLGPFLGQCVVVDLAPMLSGITAAMLKEKLAQNVPSQGKPAGSTSPSAPPRRILFRTAQSIRYDVFENDYAHFTPELVEYAAELGVELIGIDTPSVDHINAKVLEVHHKLLEKKMTWLENLDLTGVSAGSYILVALPLKFSELEASPVRAVLLDCQGGDVGIFNDG